MARLLNGTRFMLFGPHVPRMSLGSQAISTESSKYLHGNNGVSYPSLSL